MSRFFLAFASALLVCAQSSDKAFPAHRVIGNVYYVGSANFSSYLVATPAGHVLINSSFEETVPLIRASVEKLGFRFADIKILLTSHAHSDHAAAHALVKELTGASVQVMEGDQDLIASGGKGDFQYPSRWKPCKVDRVLHDGDRVELGGSTLIARLTPGHTRGCTTWTMRVADAGKQYDVVVVGSPNVNPGYKLVNNAGYPEIAADFARTFRVLKSLACDVFLGAHGSYYGMEDKYGKLQKGAANPFIDREGYKRFVDLKDRAYLAELERQRKAGGN